VALHGLDEALGIRYRVTPQGYLRTRGDRAWIRYADDFVVLCATRDDAEQVVAILQQWLAERGLSLSEEKTRIVHVSEGFDFLGFTVRQYRTGRKRTGTVTLLTPSTKAIKAVRRKLSEVWATAGSRPLKETILTLNAITRGWANYYRPGCSAKTFSGLDHWMFQKACRFAVRRHRTKGKRWLVAHYFTRRGGDHWVFRDPQSGATLRKFSQTKVVRHVPVQGHSSPDDAKLAAYWEARRRGRQSMLSVKRRHMARAQDWVCPVCGEPLENGEVLRIHHTEQVGGHAQSAAILMHLFCRQQVQSFVAPEAVSGS